MDKQTIRRKRKKERKKRKKERKKERNFKMDAIKNVLAYCYG